MEKLRFNHIDVAKGISILLVVLGHMLANGMAIKTVIYSFHMPLFFILSGVFASTFEKYDFMPYLKKNIKTLLVPYIITFVVCFIITAIIPEWRTNIDLLHIAYGLYDCHATFFRAGYLWFLVALFEAKIIFYFYHKFIISKNNKMATVLSLIILFFVGLFISKVTSKIPMAEALPFGIERGILAAAFYSFGYLIKDDIKNIELKKNPSAILLVLFCGILTIVCSLINGKTRMSGKNYSNEFLFAICGIMGTIAVVGISKLFQNSKFLLFCGKNSLYIYLVHYIFKEVYTYIFENVTGTTIVQSFNLTNGIKFLVTLAFSIGFTIVWLKIKNKFISKKVS